MSLTFTHTVCVKDFDFISKSKMLDSKRLIVFQCHSRNRWYPLVSIFKLSQRSEMKMKKTDYLVAMRRNQCFALYKNSVLNFESKYSTRMIRIILLLSFVFINGRTIRYEGKGLRSFEQG